MTHTSPTSKEENSALLDDAQAEAVKWNACCAALRAAILKYIKSNFTTATAGKAERELLEVGTLFYKDAGQNLLNHIAALTVDDDAWLKPPPHFKPDPRWQRQPQSDEEWNAHKDTDRQFNAKRRLAFAGDVDDPRAPKCMALVSRLDLSVVLGRLTWLEARFENTSASALPSPPSPDAKEG